MSMQSLRNDNGLRPLAVCVEDDPLSQRLMAALLESNGYDAKVFSNAEEALDEIREDLPDVVLMDIDLPGMSGITAVEIIRSTPVLSHLPVIAATGRVSREDVEKGTAAGFTHYMTKPIDIRGLGEILSEIAGARG